MSQIDGRHLDLNLLEVLVAVADAGSVTAAATRLYLTQSAVSAALKRLAEAVGAPLLARRGRGIELTSRGRRLVDQARPHLEALVRAVRAGQEQGAPPRAVRIGLADASERWLLSPLVRAIARDGPSVRLVVLPVQFRSVGAMLASGAVDLAVTVADELPAGVVRRPLFSGDFVCLFDPRLTRVGRRLDRAKYLAHGHVIVSYNGDLRGIVEDAFGLTRDVRVSLPSFHAVGEIVEGSALLATVPRLVAHEIRRHHPRLRTLALPVDLSGTPTELLTRAALADDEVLQKIEGHVLAIAARAARLAR